MFCVIYIFKEFKVVKWNFEINFGIKDGNSLFIGKE